LAKVLPAIPGMVFPQLPVTVQHPDFEPASSLLSRLAAKNGVQSIQQFCRDLAFPIEPLFRGERAAIEQLAGLAGCQAAALDRVSIRHLGRGHFRLRDEIVTTHMLHRSRVRVCPECVRSEVPASAEAWHLPRRLQWKLVSLRTCPEHGCMLVSLPPEKFTKDGKDFTAQIRKHFDWVLSQAPVPAEQSAFEHYLTARVLKGRGDEWIDSLDLNVASRACEVLGLLLAKGPDVSLSGHTEKDWAQFGAAGFEVLKEGAEALSTCLRDQVAQVEGDRRFFAKVYGPLITWLRGRGLGEEFEPLRDVVRGQIFQTFSIRKGILVLGVPSEGITASNVPAVLPVTEFIRENARLLVRRGLAQHDDLGHVVLKGFVTEGMLKSFERERLAESGGRLPASPHGTPHGPLERPVLSRASDAETMSIPEAARFLRVTARTVSYLAEHRFLERAKLVEGYRAGSLVFQVSSLRMFHARYVSLGELVEETRHPQGALAMKLRNAGLDMLAMPPDFSRIFWREDVDLSGLKAGRQACAK